MSDVLVIGGGVIGLTVAWELSKAGRSVTVLDQGAIGQEASWAGAGMLLPGNPQAAETAEARLRAASAVLWPGLSEMLQSDTGIDNGFRTCGGLEVRLGTPANALDAEMAVWQAEGVAVERLTAADLKRLEPHLTAEITAAYRMPQMGQVRNPRHLKALAAACTGRGVALKPGVAALSFDRAESRVIGLTTTAGTLRADEYVLCGGAWSGRMLASVGCPTPIQPVRGQIALLNGVPLPVSHVVNRGPNYLVPRPDGRILIGATQELAGFEKRNTAAGVGRLLAFAAEICPALAQATLERTWSGLRPGSADGLPYLGRVPGFDNLTVAAGHFRAGLHLSPITGVLISQLLQGQRTTVSLKPYAPDRHVGDPHRLPALHPE